MRAHDQKDNAIRDARLALINNYFGHYLSDLYIVHCFYNYPDHIAYRT